MKLLYSLLFISFCLLQSCSVNPGVDPDELGVTGKVVVVSDISGATIFADNKSTGKVTPDTISLTAGTHSIRIEKDGYLTQEKPVTIVKQQVTLLGFTLEVNTAEPKYVLLEDFSNASCVPCVTTNKILQNFNKTHQYAARTIMLKFPASYPSPFDPMYLDVKANSDARLTYYNVFSTPSIWIDGSARPTPSDSLKIRDAISLRLAKAAPFRISITDSIIANELRISVTITYLDSVGVDFTQLTLNTAVVEDSVVYSTPPGSNGESVFYDVLRALPTGNTGESLPAYTRGAVRTFTYSVPLAAKWVSANLSVIGFVQSRKTKEVYQAKKK